MKRNIQPDWIKFFKEIGKELIDDYKSRNIIGPLGDCEIETIMKKYCNTNYRRCTDFYGSDYKEMYYSFLIVYLASTIHETLGNGFKEVVYQDALEQEFFRAGIPYVREKHLVIYYNNEIIRTEKKEEIELQNTFRADFFCADSIIVELKATFLKEIKQQSENNPAEYYVDKQIKNYMAATKSKYAILLNFGEKFFNRVYKDRNQSTIGTAL